MMGTRRHIRLHGAATVAFLILSLSSPTFGVEAAASPAVTLFGLQPFPYDFTREALDKVHELAASQGTLAVIHRDNGIPWAEALKDAPFPASVENEWNDLARRVPPGRETYLALGPLAEDRVSMVPASEGSSIPAALRNARLDDEAVKTAYLNYARRAVQRFHPRFLNLGIEAGELAARSPERWPAFAALYEHVRSQLKREYPELLIGISFGLPSLMTGDVGQRVKGLVAASDFLGLSFYPYMSEFHEKFGAAPLSEPPGQWRDALAWAAHYTDKPLAICETGYSTRNVDLPAFKLHLKGSPELQEQYVSDLGQIARRDHYLFVVWSISVDYEPLYKKLPPGDGRYLLWQNVGFFDSQLQPRPAWEAWKRIARADAGVVAKPASDGLSAQVPGGPLRIGFAGPQDLFAGPAYDRVGIEKEGPEPGKAAMRWSFSYEKDRWQWLVKELRRGDLGGRKSFHFSLRSDRKGPLFVQLEEQGGETFFTMVDADVAWQRVSRDLTALSADPKKREDGRLDANQIVKILVADSAGALEGASGARTIWIADWVFE